MPIYDIEAPNGKIYSIEAPEGAKDKDLFGFVQQQIEQEQLRRMQIDYGPGMLETFTRGVKRGFGQLGSAVTDVIPGMVGSALGYEDYAKQQMAEAAQKQQELEEKYPTVFRSYKEIAGPADALKYATETIGEQVPNILTSIIPGVGGGALAARTAATAAGRALAAQAAERGLAGAAAEQFIAQGLKAAPEVARATARGQAAGIYLGSYAQNAPEIFQNIYENTGSLAPGASALFGAGAAALDAVLPATLLKNMSGPVKLGIVEKVLEKSGMDKGLLRSVTANALQSMGFEGLTEGAQEAISIFAEKFVADHPQVFGSKEWDRIMESSIKGAVAGGAFGTVGGAAEGVRGRREDQAAIEQQRALEQQQRQQAAIQQAGQEIEGIPGQAQQYQLPGMELGAASQLYTPEPSVVPTVAGKAPEQREMFTPEGALTPAMEQAAERDVKNVAIQQRKEQRAAQEQLKQDQQTLKDAIAELTNVPTDIVGLAQQPSPLSQTIAQAKTDLEAIAAKRGTPAITPTAVPAATSTTPTVEAPGPTVITDDVLKGFGIGHTALLRKNKILEGKDIANPADAAEVKRVLEAYAENRSAPIRTKIDEFLARPEFKGGESVAEPIEPTGGVSTGVAGQPPTGPTAETIRQAEPRGMAGVEAATEQPAVGESEQPSALTPEVAVPEAPKESPVIQELQQLNAAIQESQQAPTEQQAPETVTAQPEAIAKEAAPTPPTTAPTTTEPVEPIAAADTAVNELLNNRFQNIARGQNVATETVPTQDFTGTDEHTTLRIPHLLAQRDALQTSLDNALMLKGPKAKQKQASIRKSMSAIDAELDRVAPGFLQQFEAIPERQKPAVLSELTRSATAAFDAKAKAATAKLPKKPTKGRFFSPAYKGPALNEQQQDLARNGDVNGLLRSLIGQEKNRFIKQVLCRLRSLNLNTKLVIGAVENNKAGSYDSATGTITLDPNNGLNAHTVIHEIAHAAISKVLANPNHPLTKQFAQFFQSIQSRLGAAYGAQDLQEFAAELVGNPEFQAVLKSIKTPRSESMFSRIMRSIAEFFGFPAKDTAFEKGLEFVNNAIDITNGVEATPAQRLFLGMGEPSLLQQVNEAMPKLVGRTIEDTKNALSNMQGGGMQEIALAMMPLDQINSIYKTQLPSLQKVINAAELRAGMVDKSISHIKEVLKWMRPLSRTHKKQVATLNDIAIDARIAKVDILDPNFKPTDENRQEYNRLKNLYATLDPKVQNIYVQARKDFDSAFNEYMQVLYDAANSASPSLAAKLRQQFEMMKPNVGYVPFLRYGDFWLEYTDPESKEPVVMAFESVRQRDAFIKDNLTNVTHRTYQNFNDIKFDGQTVPPGTLIHTLMQELRSKNASQEQLDAVYHAYLETFPAQSILKQFMKSKNRAGMERDLVRNYAEQMFKWSHKLANSKYVPQMDRAFREIEEQAGGAYRVHYKEGDEDIIRAFPTVDARDGFIKSELEGKKFTTETTNTGSPEVYAAARNVIRQASFIRSPSYNSLISKAATLSYVEFMLANISSALINVLSLPTMVYPILAGNVNFKQGDILTAMTAAGKAAMGVWNNNPRYKKLYETLMDHGQLTRTMAKDVFEARRRNTEDYFGISARVMDLASSPFNSLEKYNRAVTAIAAYELSRSKGMPEQEAIRYALDTVKEAHTSGMAVTGSRFMQTPLGRMFLTFKNFQINSAIVVAKAFYQSAKNQDPAIRNAARRQLLTTYGIAMAVAGIKGMPFYGAASVLATALSAMFGDDDEPFDFNEFMRNTFSELLYKGPVNAAFNLEIANRAGVATDFVFRDDPRRIAEHGYVVSAILGALGPTASIAENMGNAVKMFNEGHIERSLETAMPSAVRNVLKGMRYFVEGATTLKGDPVMEDIGAYNSLMQLVGFSPANLSSQYEVSQARSAFQKEVLQRRGKLMQLYDMGATSGDSELVQEALTRIRAFNEKHPAIAITGQSLQRSMRARQKAEQEMIHGIRFNKKLTPEILALYPELE